MGILRDDKQLELLIPDLGVTLRSVLGAAAEGYKHNQQRRWTLRYKGAVIGSVQVKDSHLQGRKVQAVPTTIPVHVRASAKKLLPEADFGDQFKN